MCVAPRVNFPFLKEVSLLQIADVAIGSLGNDYTASLVHTLGEMETAVPTLVKILQSNRFVSKSVEALKRVGSKEALDAVRKWEFEQ